ncbi:helix-turn-helix domain-containing protein [Streptomyces sp. NPDC059629]|uniref:helix-turn-helix domain-containing protein n=1 Tax=Streptomyces sp. NPDC059629 TaxID=3346889 RepID=UPI0036B44543
MELGPRVVRHGFRYKARGGHIGDILFGKQYSDEFAGISGRGAGHDPVVAHFIHSGWGKYENENMTITAHPGQVVFRDTAKPWRFWSGPGTVTQVLTVPRDQVVCHAALTGTLPRAVVSDSGTAEARLLSGYLDLAARHGGAAFSGPGLSAAQEAAVQLLLAAMGTTSAADAAGCPGATVTAAQRFIDEHLEERELTPAAIARALHISVRSLHRAFEDTESSVMSYIRHRRLQRARAQLMHAHESVAGVAARWHFSDSSHFIRQFKALYGVTPAAFIKNERRAREAGAHVPCQA